MPAKIMDFEAPILDIKDYFDEGKLAVRVVKLGTAAAQGFEFKPGQFVMISVDAVKSINDPAKPKMSSMSICSAPHEKNFFELCMRIHEKPGPSVSRYIGEKAKKGDKVRVKGPFGVFSMVEGHETAILVSTGTGIAPMMSMLRHLLATGFKGKIVFFYGCRNKNDFLYGKELQESAAKSKNLDLQVIFSREPYNGRQGYVQSLLESYAFPSDLSKVHVYLCGNPVAVSEEKKALVGRGFADANLHEEKW
ncbi:MAG: FAD-dependent oxidoreductase [archaeon]|nr:FAD-dependent oxidoreductase [archaeon]